MSVIEIELWTARSRSARLGHRDGSAAKPASSSSRRIIASHPRVVHQQHSNGPAVASVPVVGWRAASCSAAMRCQEGPGPAGRLRQAMPSYRRHSHAAGSIDMKTSSDPIRPSATTASMTPDRPPTTTTAGSALLLQRRPSGYLSGMRSPSMSRNDRPSLVRVSVGSRRR